MKILILSWRCIKNPAAGGSELYFHELAKSWIKSGHEVVWFSPMFPNAKKTEKYEGVEIIRRGNRLSVYFFAFLNYITGKLPRNFDVVIDVENGIPFFSPIYIRNKNIILHIQHIHKDVWQREFSFPISSIGLFLETKIMPRVYKKNKIITISKSSANEITESGISSFKPFIVNPGIEFYKKNKGFKKNKKPAVLFLNRIKKYKGINTLLEAANLLNKKGYKNIEFWICGGGDELEAMKEYAKELELKNVTFFGRVSEEKKQELMQKAWVFVNPSSKEGWGIVNIEANYSGTPALGSNVGGIKDSIVNGETGLLFERENYEELADKIEMLIKNKKLREKLSSGGLKWAENFHWKRKAKEYLSAIEADNSA